MELKNRIMQEHSRLIRQGHFATARIILYFLRRGECVLGLSDASWEAENILTDAGCAIVYGRNGYTARVFLRPSRRGC